MKIIPLDPNNGITHHKLRDRYDALVNHARDLRDERDRLAKHNATLTNENAILRDKLRIALDRLINWESRK